ncbi:hypothetical protein ABW19_dt0204347 [Dactylella cylindrospora]|nr:hypothetical protein ABW19_dt0204347 [Dactylella cylindrospora]
MASALDLPAELWLEVMSHLDFLTIHFTLKPVCKKLYLLARGVKLYGLSPPIWEKVFENLEYYDFYRNLVHVCLPFNLLAQNSTSKAIQAAMFTEKLDPNVKVTPDTPVKVNPIFWRIVNPSYIDVHDMYIELNMDDDNDCLDYLETRERPLPDCTCAHQNATSPPVYEMIVHYGPTRPNRISNKAGKRVWPISVLDVMWACAEAVAECPPGYEGKTWSRAWRDKNEGVGCADDVVHSYTYRDIMDREIEFQGFLEDVDFDEDGTVMLFTDTMIY